MQQHMFPVVKTAPDIKRRVFGDNSGALEMVTNHCYCTITKHLNIKLHHFRDYVTRGDISITKIGKTHQLADYLINPVNIAILLPL